MLSRAVPRAAGGSEAIRVGRPAVRRVPGDSLWRQVCSLLLRQRHLPAVLLRVLLGRHPLAGRPGIPQAAGEGRRRPASPHLLPLELSERVSERARRRERRVQEREIEREMAGGKVAQGAKESLNHPTEKKE